MCALNRIAQVSNRIAAKIVGKRQPAVAGLIEVWETVVGEDWAARVTPVGFIRARGGGPSTLEVGGDAGFSLIVQHESPILLEKINAYLGQGAVGRLRFVATELPPGKTLLGRVPAKPVAIEGIEDERLAAALGRLGGAIRAGGKRD